MAILRTKSGSSYNTKTGVKTSGGISTKVNSTVDTSQDNVSSSKFVGPDELGGKYGKNWQTMATPEEMAMVQGKTPIDTSQPSPQTAQIQPPNQGLVPYEQALKGLRTSGQPAEDIARATTVLQNKYKQALPGLQAQGQAPQDAGVGKMQAGQALQAPIQEPVSPLGGLMETDTNFDSIFTNLDKYMEPLQQKKSLLQEYQSMSKALGIEDINEELIDAKKIIEGTEDDIRAEVTAAGGFATDSQVLALANARNKSLIKNYNVLLESRDNAMQQLNTMMNLTMEDRRAAEAEFDRKMNFAFKVADFQQRAEDNARSQLNSIVTNLGYGGLLAATNGNTYEQSLIEKTLGLGVGGLAKLATYKKPLNEMEALELENQRLENQKLRQDIGTGPSANTQVVDINGRKLLINSDTGETIKEIGGGAGQDQLSMAQAQGDIDLVDSLKTHKGLGSSVGTIKLTRFTPFGMMTAKKSDFIASVEQLASQLSLESLIQAKSRGATFGALSEGEMRILSASASKIGTWRIIDKDDNVEGYKTSEANFKKELDSISNFAKLDYILKGGDPTQVGVQITSDGAYWSINSDGSYTQLR
ncbi:MAG: hypothetical protein A3F67_11000 [Verrucomicrobia bacterium RIFCSPHIGHO2_12_FULL_41_10]|nr:MAG: hypothetical protein A3F67_11000 [Verrucomicrobia bacterium RIFCSPHIGHO2_12_FULL_41_10]